jgi:hypothetical protein
MTIDGHRTSALCLLLCLTMSGTAYAYSIGETGTDGRTFLYNQPLEDDYGNAWWGALAPSDAPGQIDLNVTGEGKTVDFSGLVTIYCQTANGHNKGDWVWRSASNFGGAVMVDEVYKIVDQQVPVSAGKLFC